MGKFFFSRMPVTLVVTLFALAAFTTPACATNLVLNPSFELATATITTQFLLAGVQDWTNSNIGEALVTPNWFTTMMLFPNVGFAGPVPQTSPDGGNFVFSDGDFMNSPIQQTINGLTPGDTYNLTFYQALAEDTEPNVTFPGPVTSLWQVSLGASVQLSTMMFADGTTNTISPWKQESMTFTATNATEVLSFFAIGTGAPPLTLLDGISLVDTAPEPATICLTGIGAVLIG